MKQLIHPTKDQACTPSGLEHIEIQDPECALHIAMDLVQHDTRGALCNLAHELQTILVLHTGNLPWPQELKNIFTGITNRNSHSVEDTRSQATILMRATDLRKKMLGFMLTHPYSTMRRSIANLSDQATDPLYTRDTDPFSLARTLFSLPSTTAITGDRFSRPDRETTVAHCTSIIRELRSIISCIPRKEQLWNENEGTLIITPETVIMHRRDGDVMNGQILPHADTDRGTIVFGKPVGDVFPRRMLVPRY